MKKIHLLILPVVLLFSLLTSCSSNNASLIPDDAFIVGVIDGSKMSKIDNSEAMRLQLEPIIQQLKTQTPNTANLIDELIDNYDALGISFKDRMYFYMTYRDEVPTLGIICKIKKKKLEENIGLIAEDFDLDVSSVIKEKNNIKYARLDNSLITGWKNDVGIFIINDDASFELLENTLNRKKNQSILQNSDFKNFYSNCKDYNLWISSNVAGEFSDAVEFIDDFNEYTGIDLLNNYGHMHFDIQRDELIFTSKLRFNKSLRKVDQQKIINNTDKIQKLLSGPLDELIEIISGNAGRGYDYHDYDYDEPPFDFDSYTDEEWQEIFDTYGIESREEWEELFY